jgi:hypothetical protein
MKNKILIGIIIVLIVISGCGGLGRQTGDYEPEAVDYHKGIEGITLNFVKGYPPEKIWPESDFTIQVEIRNKGAYDIARGAIKLHGFNPRYVVPSEDEKSIQQLFGKSLGYPEGDYMLVEFEESNILTPPGEEPLSFTITAEYDYSTEASAEVCISPELNQIVKTKEKVCEIKEISLSGGQGAPVAVTRINEIPNIKAGKLNLKFIFDIENKGKGEVLGDITINEVKLGGKALSCDKSTFELQDKISKIKCELSIEKPSGPYTSIITTKLSYKYKTKLDGKIDIISE